ncbi:hypothetical protein MTR_2g038480 [Medicago truncatula]|uniref:Uncharacterized protein n=1 Tax=Medicago truncatula TaxID=3880 RepID=G7IIC9_MEDTR|nr:hypothetical protein MTR_2g038480 [Medicago truncatula]
MVGLWDAVKHAIVSNDSMMEVIFSLLHNLQAELRHRMVVLLWSIWKHRNLTLLQFTLLKWVKRLERYDRFWSHHYNMSRFPFFTLYKFYYGNRRQANVVTHALADSVFRNARLMEKPNDRGREEV